MLTLCILTPRDQGTNIMLGMHVSFINENIVGRQVHCIFIMIYKMIGMTLIAFIHQNLEFKTKFSLKQQLLNTHGKINQVSMYFQIASVLLLIELIFSCNLSYHVIANAILIAATIRTISIINFKFSSSLEMSPDTILLSVRQQLVYDTEHNNSIKSNLVVNVHK